REIPTVLISGEPMQDGIVVSFNRPGRNATGVSLFAGLSVAGCSDATPPMRSAGNRAGRHCAFPACHTACSRRAASSPPALWPLIIAAAPGRIVETPATPAEADADIGRARAVDDAALRLVVQRNDELRAIIGLAVQRLV